MLDENQINDIIAYVRYLGNQASEPVNGNADKGQLVYERSGCMSCHIMGGNGIGLGPELTRIAQMRGPGYLTKAIRHPGVEKPRDMSGFISYLVVNVNDGTRKVTGIRVNEDSFTIQIKDDSNRYHCCDCRIRTDRNDILGQGVFSAFQNSRGAFSISEILYRAKSVS